MYRLGWDERNGGNISWMLEESEVAKYLDLSNVIRTIPLGFDAASIIGKLFIVTGTGKYFKNVDGDPETNPAQVYMLTAHLPRINTIKDDQMVELAEFFGVNYRKDFLNL